MFQVDQLLLKEEQLLEQDTEGYVTEFLCNKKLEKNKEFFQGLSTK